MSVNEYMIKEARARGWGLCVTHHPLIPRYVFTAGLTVYGAGARELVVCGLENFWTAGLILGELAGLTRDGNLDTSGYAAGTLFAHAVKFRTVHASWRRPAFGRGLDVVKDLGAPDPPVWLQVLLPDKDGRWPGEEGCTGVMNTDQPDLSRRYPDGQLAPAP